MDTLILSRIQFGLSVGFHFLFPPITIGLTLFIVIFEYLYITNSEDINRRISAFLVKILAVVFAFGVASGIILPLSFGSNWARFSEFAGGFFGLPLALETVTAFTLESVFLGILVFGRGRVSRKLYFIAALCVFAGAHLSAFWIIAANSWMHTPAGFLISDNRVVLVDFFKALFNPSTGIRFLHVLVACWITGSVFVSGIAAWLLYKRKNTTEARKMLSFACVIALVTTIAQPVVGHQQIMQVVRNQPEKDAAYDGVFTSTSGAPLYLFGIPDSKNRTVHYAIGIPGLLSLLETGNAGARIRGLDEFPESEWPPVNVIFTTFHLMVLIGFVLIGTSILAFIFLRTRVIEKYRRFLLLLVFIVPLPHLANELGWIGTEMGRQPWLIYKVLKTAAAQSAAPSSVMVYGSLALLSVVFTLLSVFFLRILFKTVNKGIIS